MNRQLYFNNLEKAKIPEGMDSVNISLGLCSIFDNEYHFTHYRLALIGRKYLNKRSGIFTTDEFCAVMKKHFGSTSRQAVVNKIHTCMNHSDLPFLEKFGTATWKFNSDERIMQLCKDKFPEQRPFRYKYPMPLEILRMHREQYICFVKLCLGQKIEKEAYHNLEEGIAPAKLPSFTE